MNFLYVLEKLRCPALDVFFSLVTRLGEELLFIVIALAFFWCVDKLWGYYLMAIGFVGTVLNQFLKIVFRIPRPWVLDKNFTIVESAREAATGYSFPSGHTQSSVGSACGVGIWTKSKWLRVAMAAVAVLVPLSRVYLGVHTPLDVGVSFLIAIVLSAVLFPFIKKARDNSGAMWWIIGAMLLISALNLAFCSLYTFPLDIDAENLANAVENANKLFGAIAAIPLVYYLDEKYIKFETDGTPLFQIFKIVVGLLLVLGVQKGTKAPLLGIFSGHMVAHLVRYFLLVFVAGVVWPFIFMQIKRKIDETRGDKN